MLVKRLSSFRHSFSISSKITFYRGKSSLLEVFFKKDIGTSMTWKTPYMHILICRFLKKSEVVWLLKVKWKNFFNLIYYCLYLTGDIDDSEQLFL